MNSWYCLNETELILSIFVKTNARKTEIAKADQERLHIFLHAKPKDGEANAELIQFLSKYFHLPKTQISVRRGEHSRYKQIVCQLEKNQRTTRRELYELLAQTGINSNSGINAITASPSSVRAR